MNRIEGNSTGATTATGLLLALVAAGLLLGLTGCKESVPESDLDKFIARTETLDGQALEDTLQALAAGPAPFSAYAHYLLGNRAYAAAGDSAATVGWGDDGVGVLLATAEAPFGGIKESGMGREGASLGIKDYLEPKYIKMKL